VVDEEAVVEEHKLKDRSRRTGPGLELLESRGATRSLRPENAAIN
jgi:hypothetical protein